MTDVLPYSEDYYAERHQRTLHAASEVLSRVLDVLPEVHSAVDFGCGVGTWLSVLSENRSVSRVHGLDGDWVNTDLLEIARESFQNVNFEEPIRLEENYDLAISLEVAEHLSEDCSTDFVCSLASASDFILFSAAIPFQSGRGHVNEQWPEYWVAKFEENGFVCLDFIRQQIWNDDAIPYWYRQNVLLFVKREMCSRLRIPDATQLAPDVPASLVHPDMLLTRMGHALSQREHSASLGESWKLFRRALVRRAKDAFRTKSD